MGVLELIAACAAPAFVVLRSIIVAEGLVCLTMIVLMWPTWRGARLHARLLLNALVIGNAAAAVAAVDLMARSIPGGLTTLVLLVFQTSSLLAYAHTLRAQRSLDAWARRASTPPPDRPTKHESEPDHA